MTRLLIIFLLALSGIAGASVTAAWKVPIESRVPDLENDERVRKLDKPPGESAFFEAGDELWEVSRALSWEIFDEVSNSDDPFAEPTKEPVKVGLTGEWVVWNERSRMFIARGSWCQILLVGEVLGFEDQPFVLRSKFEVVEGIDTATSKPLNTRSLSIVSRSGENVRAALEGFEVEVGCVASGSVGISDANCQFSWPAGVKDRRWEVRVGITVREGDRTPVARQGTGADSWEAWLTVSRELVDGTPIRQGRSIETAAGIQPWTLLEPDRKDIRKILGPNRELGIYPVPEDLLLKLTGARVPTDLPDVVAPAELAEWVRASLMDIRKPLREHGLQIDAAAGQLAGFDPRTRSVVIVADPTKQDLAEDIFWYGSRRIASLWIETNSASGGWGLAVRSGEKASISRRASDVTELLFEIEPTLGGDGDIMDLRYKFDVVSGEGSMGRIDSATTLNNGKPQKVATYSKTETEELEVVITGTVVGE